ALEDLESTSYTKGEEIEGALIDSFMVEGKHKANVLKVYEQGIITGYPDGTFKPEMTLTRAEGVAVIRRIIDKGARKPYISKGTNYADHFKGGKLWVDPVRDSDEKNIAADLKMIESDKVYYDKHGSYEWDDHLGIIIKYSEYGKPVDQLKDLERLLRRRLSEEHVHTILDYIKHKDGWRTLLNEEHKWYNMDNYRIAVVDERQLKGSKFERSLDVTIQMWYE
ncbi:S-layer homology domain-containing protein, partial [Petrocella sp. FN5]|uniref:S-layer homology domain-containing protein n=1 Tax=Petrocella sp. FN5 TaxID=3032002 RepID=UPI0023DA2D57